MLLSECQGSELMRRQRVLGLPHRGRGEGTSYAGCITYATLSGSSWSDLQRKHCMAAAQCTAGLGASLHTDG